MGGLRGRVGTEYFVGHALFSLSGVDMTDEIKACMWKLPTTCPQSLVEPNSDRQARFPETELSDSPVGAGQSESPEA